MFPLEDLINVSLSCTSIVHLDIIHPSLLYE